MDKTFKKLMVKIDKTSAYLYCSNPDVNEMSIFLDLFYGLISFKQLLFQA